MSVVMFSYFLPSLFTFCSWSSSYSSYFILGVVVSCNALDASVTVATGTRKTKEVT